MGYPQGMIFPGGERVVLGFKPSQKGNVPMLGFAELHPNLRPVRYLQAPVPALTKATTGGCPYKQREIRIPHQPI